MAATQWATIENVNTLTGRTIDEVTRTLAVTAIELHTGLIEEVERADATGRDLYWLKLAVAYQAVWLVAQPDYLERSAVGATSQDGVSVAPGNPDWLTLAPLARKAIKRLSFKGMRSILPTRDERARRLDPNSEEYDNRLPWVPA